MDDTEILGRIEELVEEERRLRDSAGRGDVPHTDTQRLRALELSLDQCWDLLRQRRGKRHAGADPDDAAPRDPRTVEHYEQ